MYVNFIYWASCVSGGGAYGDIFAMTPYEKLFQVFSLLFFRTYFSLVSADISNIVTASRATVTEYKNKMSLLETWMKSTKLDVALRQRIRRYYSHIWDKFKGLDENSIINDLPQTLREEILAFLLNNMIKHIDLFPKNDEGFLLNIVKIFSFVTIPQDEFVFRVGEVATEIYFILEGSAAIYSKDTNTPLANVEKNDFFGDISLIKLKPLYRMHSVKAVSNLSLAILKADDLIFLRDKYKKAFDVIQSGLNRRKEDLSKKEEKRRPYSRRDRGMAEYEKMLEGFSDPEDHKRRDNIENSIYNDNDNEERKSEHNSTDLKPIETGAHKNPKSIIPALQTGKMVKEFEVIRSSKPELPSLISPKSPNGTMLANSHRNLLHSNRNFQLQSPIGSQRVRFQYQNEDKEFEKFEEAVNSMLEHPFSQRGLPTPNSHNPLFSPGSLAMNLPIHTPGRAHELSVIKESARAKAEALISVRSQHAVTKELQPIIKELGIQETDPSEGSEDKQSQDANNAAIFQSIDMEQQDVTKKQKSTKFGRTLFEKTNIWPGLKRIIYKKAFPPNGCVRKKLNSYKRWHLRRRTLIIFLIYFWSVIFLPLNLGFPHTFKFEGITLAAELLCTFLLLVDSTVLVNKYLEGKERLMQVMPKAMFLGISQSQVEDNDDDEDDGEIKAFNVKGPIPFLIYIFLQSCPWCLIFQVADVGHRTSSIVLLLLQMLRLTHLSRLFGIFTLSFFSKKFSAGIQNMVIAIYTYTLLNHVFGCILVIIGNLSSDFNDSWLSTLPAPRQDWPLVRRDELDLPSYDIYLYATYWSSVTSSHLGIGDVKTVSLVGKAYNMIVNLLTTFTFAIFFGIIASLVESLVPMYQKNFQVNYSATVDYIKRCHFDQFLNQVDVISTFRWYLCTNTLNLDLL